METLLKVKVRMNFAYRIIQWIAKRLYNLPIGKIYVNGKLAGKLYFREALRLGNNN